VFLLGSGPGWFEREYDLYDQYDHEFHHTFVGRVHPVAHTLAESEHFARS
jgi:hypothetical protein